jgi:hypothetical protein
MTASPKQNAIRRSTRLPLEIPVVVTSLDPACDFSQEGVTTLVNAHGCGMVVQSEPPRGLRIQLEIANAKRRTTGRIADVVPLGGTPESWLVGVEFDAPGNCWGIDYAPSDWKMEESLAPAAASAAVPSIGSGPIDQASRRWRLTDVSPNACYLEAAAPFAVSTPVLLSARVAGFECLLDGIVRVSHPDLGMGVEFVSETSDHRERADELIQRLVSKRETPRIFVGRKENVNLTRPAADAPAIADSDVSATDPLLELIRNGDSLPVDEFQSRLKAQRAS